MTATTFLTGQEATRPPEPPLVAGPRLSFADGLRLLQTPSSEAGVQAYHRALEGEPVDPQSLLAELSALREGRATRFELLAQIATGPRAQARGVQGVGLLLIRIARKALIVSGAADRIRARRSLSAQSDLEALSPTNIARTPSDVSRKLVVLEGAVLRLENRAFAQGRVGEATPLAALEARIAALEFQMRSQLADEAADRNGV